MKRLFFTALSAAALSACTSGDAFTVGGEVANADGKMLYLEASALEGVQLIDSVRLKGDGAYKFHHARPESPEYYRLRVDDQVINFSIDSTETVTIKANLAENFAGGYSVEGSDNCQRIKELTLKQAALQAAITAALKDAQARTITPDDFQTRVAELVKEFKDDVRVNYIFAMPNTSSAYFALFQKVNGYFVFDPMNSKEDVKCFRAVATSLNAVYPHADRSKNLYNITVKGMKNTRTPQQKAIEIPEEKISESGIINIALRDMKGRLHELKDLKGKAVILDFTIYQTAVSAAHNYLLRDLYDKYADRGLEIYQVSLDADEHYWKTTADNLPWICVRDAAGIYSTLVQTYNVQALPTLFLINKSNELRDRTETIEDLEAAVKALL